MKGPYDRGALVVGVVALVSILFTFATSSNNNFVTVEGLGIVALAVVGLVAILGGALHQPIVTLAAGGLAAVTAVAILVQLSFAGGVDGNRTIVLSAQASTMSLFAGLAMALLVLGYLGKNYPDGVETGLRTTGEEATRPR